MKKMNKNLIILLLAAFLTGIAFSVGADTSVSADSDPRVIIRAFCEKAVDDFENTEAKVKDLGGTVGLTDYYDGQTFKAFGFRLIEDPVGIRHEWKEHDIYVIMDDDGRPAFLNISYKEFRGGYTVDTKCCTHWIVAFSPDGGIREFDKDFVIHAGDGSIAPRYPDDIRSFLSEWKKSSRVELDGIIMKELKYWLEILK